MILRIGVVDGIILSEVEVENSGESLSENAHCRVAVGVKIRRLR